MRPGSSFFRVLALGVLVAAGIVEARDFGTPVTTDVAFVDSEGHEAALQFQGTVKGRRLRGVMMAEGKEFRVSGVVAAGGDVSGTLLGPDGTSIGTFTARMDATRTLRGSYLVFDQGGGSLTAQADALPTHGSGRRTARDETARPRETGSQQEGEAGR